MKTLSETATLVLIDVQQAFNNPAWGQRNNPEAERKTAELLAAWRARKRPLIHVRHINPRPGSLFNPDSEGAPFKPEALPLPGEPVIQKDVNSAFIGTDLEARLRAFGADTIVLSGLTTDHCVSTTARMAANLGFVTYVVSDATATFERTSPDGRYYTAEEMHDSAITSLNGEFASIVDTVDVLGALR